MSSYQEMNISNKSYDELMEKIKKWGQEEQIVPVIRDIPEGETLIRKALKNIGKLVSSTPELKGNTRCYSCNFYIGNNIKLPDGRSAKILLGINERNKIVILKVRDYIHNLLCRESLNFDEVSKLIDEIERYVIPMKLEIEGADDKADKKYACKILEMMITVKE